MTWGQIMNTHRRGLGSETISRDSLKVQPPTHLLTGDQELLSFHFGGAARFIGYRLDEVLHVVWVDPNHRVYPG
jgi:hypothetical protein